jgi:hypothetical protein
MFCYGDGSLDAGIPGSVASSAYVSKSARSSPGETKDSDIFVNSGTVVHAASIFSIDLKKGFKDSSKAAREADPGITQAAILKTLIEFLRNAAFRSL